MRPKKKADGSIVEEEPEEEEEEKKAPPSPPQPKPRSRTPKRKPAVKPSAAAIAADDGDAAIGDGGSGDPEVDNKEFGAMLRSAVRESRKLRLKQGVTVVDAAPLSHAKIAHMNRNVSAALIHNVVAKASFNHLFSVADLAMRLHGLHNRRKFSAPVCLGMKNPRVTALVFSTGTVLVVGAKSVDIARLAIYRLADYIARQTGVVVRPSGLAINNIMATVYLGYRIDLKRVCTQLKQANGDFPKIVFGAAKIYVKYGVVMLFSSGKFVVCGPRNTDQLTHIREELMPQLAQFHDGDVDLEQQRREQQEAKELERRESERRRLENDILKIRKKIETGKRRIRHRYPSSSVGHIVDVEEIQMAPCMHLVGARVALTNAAKKGIKLPVPTVAAIHASSDVCRHRLMIRFKNAMSTKLHRIGWMGSMDILRLYRQNGLPIPDHFSVPPPPVQKRRGSTKNPHGEDGEFHQIEGEVLRFDFVGTEQPKASGAGGKRRRASRDPPSKPKKKKQKTTPSKAAAAAAKAAK